MQLLKIMNILNNFLSMNKVIAYKAQSLMLKHMRNKKNILKWKYCQIQQIEFDWIIVPSQMSYIFGDRRMSTTHSDRRHYNWTKSRKRNEVREKY